MSYKCPFCNHGEKFEAKFINPEGMGRTLTSIECTNCHKPIGIIDHTAMEVLTNRITNLEIRIKELQNASQEAFQEEQGRIKNLM